MKTVCYEDISVAQRGVTSILSHTTWGQEELFKWAGDI